MHQPRMLLRGLPRVQVDLGGPKYIDERLRGRWRCRAGLVLRRSVRLTALDLIEQESDEIRRGHDSDGCAIYCQYRQGVKAAQGERAGNVAQTGVLAHRRDVRLHDVSNLDAQRFTCRTIPNMGFGRTQQSKLEQVRRAQDAGQATAVHYEQVVDVVLFHQRSGIAQRVARRDGRHRLVHQLREGYISHRRNLSRRLVEDIRKRTYTRVGSMRLGHVQQSLWVIEQSLRVGRCCV